MSNSLSKVHPELVPEWSDKNLPLTPETITFGSNKKVWWKGACGHEWQTSVKARSSGESCPICSGARVIAGINDLATLGPLLAQEWSNKNDTKSTEVSVGSHKKIIWRCDKGHEWEASVKSRTINRTGIPLNEQELSNAIHSGPFVTKAKEEFSNSQNANIQKWSAYISGSVIRQDYLRTALDWVSKGNIDDYMSRHRNDNNIAELKTYFISVIDWISSIFSDIDDTMRGLDWGRLYEMYHKKSYNPQEVSDKVRAYLEDYYVKDKKGIYEYLLGGCIKPKLLNVRVFDDVTKKSVYTKQSNEVKGKEKSNCPLCALSSDNNKNRIWKLNEMDADHVTAWSNGGTTDVSNCQMLCKTHNRAKGNR